VGSVILAAVAGVAAKAVVVVVVVLATLVYISMANHLKRHLDLVARDGNGEPSSWGWCLRISIIGRRSARPAAGAAVFWSPMNPRKRVLALCPRAKIASLYSSGLIGSSSDSASSRSSPSDARSSRRTAAGSCFSVVWLDAMRSKY
jgi:hypothetical protein